MSIPTETENNRWKISMPAMRDQLRFEYRRGRMYRVHHPRMVYIVYQRLYFLSDVIQVFV
jgi:hypothetical protein